MSDKRIPYNIILQVTYTFSVPVKAFDEDEAVDEVEKIIKESGDYEIVNRSETRTIKIAEVKEDWARENKSKRTKKR